MNQCNKCHFWEPVYKNGFMSFGTCSNGSAIERVRVTQEKEPEQDEPVLFTESCFGCVYFQNESLAMNQINLFDIT